MGTVNPSLSPLLGNAGLRAQLLRLVAEERLHHCLLFEGPAGVGKASTARWLALVVNCEAEPAARPCGTCWSCRQILRDAHPDVLVVGLDPERTAPIISVEQARKVVGQLGVHPYSARRRFVLFDPADAMSPEAANALLKTFEEPPASTGFILITSAISRLLPTIRSRAQRVRFSPVTESELLPWLVARGVAQPAMVAGLAQGCPGRALSLAEGEAEAWKTARDALIEALGGGPSEQFRYAEALVKGERSEWLPRVEQVLDLLAQLGTDALHLRARPDLPPVRLRHGDRISVVQAWADSLSAPGLARLGQAIDAARRELEGYVNARLLVEALLATVTAELGPSRISGVSP